MSDKDRDGRWYEEEAHTQCTWELGSFEKFFSVAHGMDPVEDEVE